MSAVEYDVLVKLRVDRATQKGLGESVKPLDKGLTKIEKDRARAQKQEAARQKAAGREFLRQQLATERSIAKATAQRMRTAAAAQRLAGREAARTARLQERAAAAAAATRGRQWTATKSGAGNAAGAMAGMGMGPGPEWAAKVGAIIGAAIVTAVGAGIGTAVLSGIGDNIKQEQFRGQTATALQLFDFNATDAKGAPVSAADQFKENLDNAKWYQQELVRIADASPGDQEQVGDLFSGLLPGMASVTQDADRIVDLTQKATLLSGVLGNRFKMVGEQSSRIITGGAGAEMDTWRLLQKPIKEAGEELGVFKKNSGMVGEKLTMAFNKLDPEKRLAIFEKGLEKLGPEVAAYFENSFEGITAQASSALKTLRKELGRGGFDALKSRLKQSNKEGILNQKSPEFQKLKDFMGYLGERFGAVIVKAIDIAENVAVKVANNWQTIVTQAQVAGHYLKSGAETAVALLGARAGAGAIAGVAGGGMKAAGGLVGAIGGLVAMGPAALVAAPALLAFGVVAGGAAIIFGGAVAYIVTNLDKLTENFMAWKDEAGPTIDAFWKAVDDLSAKFLALGEYFIGPADSTDIFTTATTVATNIVYGVTEAFSLLLGVTADVVEGFGGMMDNLAVFVGTFTGSVNATKLASLQNELNRETMVQQGAFESDASFEARRKRAFDYGITGQRESLEKQIAEEEAKLPTFGATSKEWASSIRAGKLRFDLATANRPDPTRPDMGMYGTQALGPQKPNTLRATPKPPKVNVKQTIHNHWNIRDVDPNAIVAAHNKSSARSVAQAAQSAMSLGRRSR